MIRGDSDMKNNNGNSMEDIHDDFSKNLSDITSSLRRTHIDSLSIQCVICKERTFNKVQRDCEGKCCYVCHDECLNKWIRYKNRNAFCVMCNKLYSKSEINRVFGGATIHI